MNESYIKFRDTFQPCIDSVCRKAQKIVTEIEEVKTNMSDIVKQMKNKV